MKRRTFLRKMSVVTAWSAISLLFSVHAVSSGIAIEPLNKPRKAWRGLISPEAYRVLFEEHTEEPGSSELNDEHREGTFICAACYLPLLESKYKYESGSG